MSRTELHREIRATKRVLVFDLDGTLTPSKTEIDGRMVAVLTRALDTYQVCIISGGAYRRFEEQLLLSSWLIDNHAARLYLMPTCGTQCFQYNASAKSWQRTYADVLLAAEKERIVEALTQAIRHFGFDQEVLYGERIEDRETQVTYSALGQDVVKALGNEGLRLKSTWDPDDQKKRLIRDFAARLLPGYEVRISSPTSIDVTKPGMDKAYGVRKLMSLLF